MTCTDGTKLPLYVIVEKILAAEETLPEQWLLAGTTGYDFLNSAGGCSCRRPAWRKWLRSTAASSTSGPIFARRPNGGSG